MKYKKEKTLQKTCKELHLEDLRYGFSTGRIRMLENRLLDWTTLEQMIDAENVEAAIHHLENKYGHISIDPKNIGTPAGFETICSNELYKLYLELNEFVPDREIIDIFFYKYTFHNIKVLLKAKYLKEEEGMDMIYVAGPIPFLDLRDILFNNKKEHPFVIIKEKAEGKFLENHNSQIIDFILDQEYFKWIQNITSGKNVPVINTLIKIWIDLANIKNLFRCLALGKEYEILQDVIYPGGFILKEIFSNFYIQKNWEILNQNFRQTPYEALINMGIESLKNNTITLLERKLENFLLKWLEDSKYIVFGIEPIIHYILQKELEIRLIRTIIISKLYNISPELIRKRVGEIYV